MAEDLFHDPTVPFLSASLLDLLLHKQIPTAPTPEQRFKTTLNGCILDFVNQAGPVNTDAITAHVRANLPALKHIDGSSYTEDAQRMVNGCLSQSDLFTLTPEGWTLDRVAARRYRDKTIASIKKHTKEIHVKPKNRKDYANRKTERLVNMFQDFVRRLRADPETAVYLASPLGTVTGQEDPMTIITQLGPDRAAGLVLAYQLLRDNYKRLAEDQSRSPAAMGVAEQMRDILENLQEAERVVKRREVKEG